MTMNMIETIGLSKQFKTVKAVNDINIKVPQGAICGFLGKNGAGKTTAIKMLVGLTKPTSGSIMLSGSEVKFGERENSNIGYVPDVPNFYGYMTANEYLKFCGNLYGIKGDKLSSLISELLKKVGLSGKNKTKISGYSRGMKQRLGIAQALINQPEMIFMDEPISALDPTGRYEVMEIIRSLKGTVTIFFSTHILADVENTCDHIIILDKGRVLEENGIAELKQKYSSNTAKVKFFSDDDNEKFVSGLKNISGLCIQKQSFSDVLVKAEDRTEQELGEVIFGVLGGNKLVPQSYCTYTPSLEEIFLGVTK